MPEKKKTAAAAPAVEAPAAEAKETKETKTRKSAKASARRGRPPLAPKISVFTAWQISPPATATGKPVCRPFRMHWPG